MIFPESQKTSSARGLHVFHKPRLVRPSGAAQRVLALTRLGLLVATVGGGMHVSAWAQTQTPFGPWAAGEVKQIERQGVKGIPRFKHPVVGDPAKVPGEGPPPPELRPDPDVPETALVSANRPALGLSSNPLYLSALFYRHLFTKIDGPRCQHLPTCSRFANQAVARHGPLGIVMGLDRLIRSSESSSVRTLPQVEGWGSVRYLDPVDNYEFWKEEKFTGFPAPTDEQPLRLESSDTAAPPINGAKTSQIPTSQSTGLARDVAPNPSLPTAGCLDEQRDCEPNQRSQAHEQRAVSR